MRFPHIATEPPDLMNAPALNPASAPPAGSVGTGGTAAVAGKAGAALAGFEALLAALFPQGSVTGTPVVAATPDKANVDLTLDPGSKGPGDEVPGDEVAGLNSAPLSGDASALLLVGAIPAQPANATTGTGPTEQAQAFGRDKGKGIPAAPALLNANPRAGLADKAEPADGSLVDSATTTNHGRRPDTPSRQADAPMPSSAAIQSARSAAPASSSPVVSDTPDIVGANPVVATADPNSPVPVPAPPVTATAPESLATTLTAAGLVARHEPTPTPASRSQRTDRSQAATDPVSSDGTPDGQGIVAAAAPTLAKPAAVAARAADGGPEIAEARSGDAEVNADRPDGTAQADARTAAQSTTPIATGAQSVRGSPETVATLAAQIIKKLEGQSTRFDVELNPAGLGKVDVRIDIGAHGRISAAMMFDNPAAAADLRARATELQRMLEQAGFDMSGGLSFDVAGDRGQQQQRQTWQDQNDNAGQAFRGQAFRAALDTAGHATDAAIEGALRLRRGVNAGLDLRI